MLLLLDGTLNGKTYKFMAFFHITLQELVSFRLELTLSIYSRAPDFILIIRIPNVTRQAGFGYEI